MKVFLMLLMIADGVVGATAQAVDCTKPPPCLENTLQKLTPLLSSGNDTLFAQADKACGGNAFNTIQTTVMSGCIFEIDKAEGCECNAECTASASSVPAMCRKAIIETYCSNAEWIEADLELNLRAIFLHLLNDCYEGEAINCPATVPPFDPAVCGAATVPVIAPMPGQRMAPARSPGPQPSSSDGEFAFQPIATGDSLGEVNAAPPAPTQPTTPVNEETNGVTLTGVSGGVVGALIAGALLLV